MKELPKHGERQNNPNSLYTTIATALLGIAHQQRESIYPEILRSSTTKDRLVNNPGELGAAYDYLTRWPIVSPEATLDLMKYHVDGKPRSLADKKGVIGEFEDTFNTTLGLNRRYTLSIASGTTGIWSAYQAMGVREGVKVAVPGYTFHATDTPLLDLGAQPIFMDARPDNGNVTPEIVRDTLEKNGDIKVVTVTHMWGIPIEGMEEIADIVHEKGALLLEDCSHAHGAKINGKSVGTFGDIAVFSCQASKGISVGEGGMILTDDLELHKAMLSKTHYRRKESEIRGMTEGSEYDLFVETGTGGIKARMHPFAAVEGLDQLKKFPNVLKARRQYADYFASVVNDIPWLSMSYVPEGAEPSWYGLRMKYDAFNNGGMPIDEYVQYLQSRGVDVHTGTSRPVIEENLFRFTPPNYRFGSRLPINRSLYLPGASSFCEDRLVFPVVSVEDPKLMQTVVDATSHIMRGANGGRIAV